MAFIAFSLMMAAPAYGAIYYVGIENPGSGQNYNNSMFQLECQGCQLVAATTEWLGREWQTFLGVNNAGQNFFSNPGDTQGSNFGFFMTGQGTWAGQGLGFSSYSLSYLGTPFGTPVPWVITGSQGTDDGSGLMTIIIRDLFPEVTEFEMLGWFDITQPTSTCNPFIQKNGNWVVQLPKNAKIALCERLPGGGFRSSLMIDGFQPFAVMRQWGQSETYPTVSGLPPGGGPIVLPPPPGGGGGGTPPTNPVPEPSSGLLAGLGAGLIAVSWAYGMRRAALKK